jgi:threonine dehydrogenase-like Zn-dependent dehydrogenase
MKAVAWHGTHDVRVDTVDDPAIEQSTDAIVRITSTGICGSDLHLYKVLGAFIDAGDILGHEPMASSRRSARTSPTSRLATAW